MPKYYIDDGKQRVVIDEENPQIACLKCCISKLFDDIVIGGYYRVSEQGFEEGRSAEIYWVPTDLVNEMWIDIVLRDQENKKDS